METISVLGMSALKILIACLFTIALSRFVFRNTIMYQIVAVLVIPLGLSLLLAANIGRGVIHFGIGIPIVMVIIVGGIFIIGKMLQKPLRVMLTKIDFLSKGDLNFTFEEKFLKGKHELGEVSRRIFQLVESLKKTAMFADNVGKGNLNVEYELLGENDILGKAMLDMRNNLVKAEMEMIERKKEDERRNWITQGIAKFSELLRHNNDSIEELCYSIISNLVKYIGANQGGVFVLEENNDGRYLEMKSCYAYDRRKFIKDKKIELTGFSTGLVTACFMEKESIYITDIPKNYIEITSGLGGDNPNTLLLTPLKLNDEIYGIIEIAGFSEFEPHVREFVEKISESIASTIGSVRVKIHTNKLLEKTKLQAEEMANSEEELRQNMEEMQATQEEMRRREIELSEAFNINKDKTEKLNLIMKASKTALWEMKIINGDPNNPDNIWIWSDELRKMLGFTDQNDFPNVGSSLWDRIHKDDFDMVDQAYVKHINDHTGKTPYDVEYRIAKKNGEYIYAHEVGVTLRENGIPTYVIGTWKDITNEVLNRKE